MNFLFFDTETSGMVNWKAEPSHASQPHIIQIAALLKDENGNDLDRMSTLVQLPSGATIEPGAQQAHGLSAEEVNSKGIPVWKALWMFDRLVGQADMLVAHNIDFDMIIVRAAHAKINFMHRLHGKKQFCTMKSSTDLVKIPGPRGYKWPKLIEAHQHFLGCGFEGAHDALADVEACARVFFCLPRD